MTYIGKVPPNVTTVLPIKSFATVCESQQWDNEMISSWRTGPAKHWRCEFVTGDVGEGLVQSNVARSTVLSEQYFCDGRCLSADKQLLPNALGKADRKGSSVQRPKQITAEKRMSWPTTAGKNSHRKVSLLAQAKCPIASDHRIVVRLPWIELKFVSESLFLVVPSLPILAEYAN